MLKTIEILFKGECIGTMENPSLDWPWTQGDFTPTQLYFTYKKFLDALCDEDENFEKPIYDKALDEELWEDKNWTGKSEDKIYEISIPAIHDEADSPNKVDGYTVSIRIFDEIGHEA
jgi:hypothetical protein